MDLTEIFVIAAAIGVFVAAVCGVFQTAFNIPERFTPLMSLVLGVILGLAASTIHPEATYAQLAWGGALAGLIASGAFDKAKKMLSKDEEQK